MSCIDFDSTWKLRKGGGLEVISKDGSSDVIQNGCYLARGGCSGIDSSLDELPTESAIVDSLLATDGGWSVIYYRHELGRLFVGRDIFGRLSLVWSKLEDSLLFSCSVHPQLAEVWNEIPYGQVTVIDVSSLKGDIHSYFASYPEDQDFKWRNDVGAGCLHHHQIKQEMITVSRQISRSLDFDPVDRLYSMMTDSARCTIPTGCPEVCVAFSGGVDSTLVAHAVVRASGPETLVTLVNVAFGVNEEACGCAPDRGRALLAFDHLRTVTSGRRLRLLLRNVNPTELESARIDHIAAAVAPAASVLDDSLGCVVWFALDGSGRDLDTGETVRSGADVFFVGSGADELFAGYARHRTRYERDGTEPVAEECEAELRRLGSRNGGRDARVATQLKRKLAAPFMDDKLIEWANQLPLEAKFDMSLPRGVGEKRIIRLALARLGAPHDAPKQAMQFGSRMAKMSNTSKMTKGSDVSDHLKRIAID